MWRAAARDRGAARVARIGSRRTIDPVGSVGGGHGDDTLARRHAVEQREQLRHRAPVIAAAARVRPLRTERVELVHEEERRGGLPTCDGCRLGLGLGPSKRRAQPCAQLVSSAPTATALQHEQREPKGSRSRAHNVGFACPGWAVQEQPRGRPHPPCPQRVGVFGEAAHQRAHRVVGAALPGEDRRRLGTHARCWCFLCVMRLWLDARLVASCWQTCPNAGDQRYDR